MKLLLLVLLILPACDDEPAAMVVNDLSVNADLTGNKPDSFLLLSCKDTEACIQLCTTPNLNTCIPACIAQLSPSGKTYFDPLQACGGPACTIVDGGAGPCTMPASAACHTCIMQNCNTQEMACQAH